MPRKVITANWNRVNRNNINENFHHLFNNTGQYDASEAADYANAQGNYANAQGTYAKNQGDHAKAQGDYANQAAENAIASLNTIHNEDENKTYNWGLKVSAGHVVFFYEEAN